MTGKPLPPKKIGQDVWGVAKVLRRHRKKAGGFATVQIWGPWKNSACRGPWAGKEDFWFGTSDHAGREGCRHRVHTSVAFYCRRKALVCDESCCDNQLILGRATVIPYDMPRFFQPWVAAFARCFRTDGGKAWHENHVGNLFVPVSVSLLGSTFFDKFWWVMFV